MGSFFKENYIVPNGWYYYFYGYGFFLVWKNLDFWKLDAGNWNEKWKGLKLLEVELLF